MAGNFYIIPIAALLLLLPPGGHGEERFGRFFTSPQQREYLNELRTREPQEELIVEIAEEEMIPEDKEAEETSPVDVVRLRGIVYRENGKSTAWLNDGNTYEGDIGSQYLEVDSIKPDNVTLDIAGDRTEIKLKAGQAYEPASRQIHDVIKQ